MSQHFKVNILNLEGYKSRDGSYKYYYNQLAIEIIKDIVGMIFISGAISAILDADDNFENFFLLGIFILLWIILCIYDFLISKTIEIRKRRSVQRGCTKDSNEKTEKSIIKVESNNSKKMFSNFNRKIRLALIVSGIISIIAVIIVNPHQIFNKNYPQRLNMFLNLYYPGLLLLFCGIFNWSFLNANKKVDIFLDTIRLIVILLGIPAIPFAFVLYQNSILWRILIAVLLSLDVYFCESGVVSICYSLRQKYKRKRRKTGKGEKKKIKI